MDFSGPPQQNVDILAIYRRYCEIKLGNTNLCAEVGKELNQDSERVKALREAMVQLTKFVDSSFTIRNSIFDELRELMSYLNRMGGLSDFTNFYDFVFFMCRESSQKNITVSTAIEAWKLVLTGRFRLLNQWCDFVEKNQRYNISEDTWRQVLAFSRCVRENLEGYDPEGAWPSLIDDFVEHMYRITGSNDCSSHNLSCRCGDPDGESSIFEEPLPGLKELPGFKRKFREDLQGNGPNGSSADRSYPSDELDPIADLKRRKQQEMLNFVRGWENPPANPSDEDSQTGKGNSPMHSSKYLCSVEGCLSEGFSGLFSSPRVQN